MTMLLLQPSVTPATKFSQCTNSSSTPASQLLRDQMILIMTLSKPSIFPHYFYITKLRWLSFLLAADHHHLLYVFPHVLVFLFVSAVNFVWDFKFGRLRFDLILLMTSQNSVPKLHVQYIIPSNITCYFVANSQTCLVIDNSAFVTRRVNVLSNFLLCWTTHLNIWFILFLLSSLYSVLNHSVPTAQHFNFVLNQSNRNETVIYLYNF